jgi:hypothetical protein
MEQFLSMEQFLRAAASYSMILTARSGLRHRRRILAFVFHARFERRGRAARRFLDARLRRLLVFRADLRLAIGLLDFALGGWRSIQRPGQIAMIKMDLQVIDELLGLGRIFPPSLRIQESRENRPRGADMFPNDAKTLTFLHGRKTYQHREPFPSSRTEIE